MKVEISNGELVDKITILQIKTEKIKDKAKLSNVTKEFNDLLPLLDKLKITTNSSEYLELYYVNSKLWVIEETIRQKEQKLEFDEDFIQIARAVYITNDHRAHLKRVINERTNSGYIEEKEY